MMMKDDGNNVERFQFPFDVMEKKKNEKLY
jgi:hypothetical protein